jgi:biopolymer transport protein ExbD
MRRVRTKPIQPMSGMELTTFTISGLVVLFTLLVAFMCSPEPLHGGFDPNLPKVSYPTSMPHAERDDALVVAIFRNGDFFFRNDKLPADRLGAAIREGLPSTRERKVYIRADARVRWATVAQVIDQVRAAGIPNVAFLANQRRPRRASP